MDLRVQGLDPAVHNLGKTGIGGDVTHRYSVFVEQFGGAAGGKNIYLKPDELPAEVHYAGLVGYADQCPFNLRHHHVLLKWTIPPVGNGMTQIGGLSDFCIKLLSDVGQTE
jgi:hypothetical protein